MKSVFFFLFSGLVLLIVILQVPDQNLHLYTCDVGQGDSILLTYKTTQILVDAGPDNSVQECLGAHIPFWDRTLEAVFLTHGDSDHSSGMTEVLARFQVQNFFATAVDNPAYEYTRMKEVIAQKKVSVVHAHAGQELIAGNLQIRILFPTEDFIAQYSTETGKDEYLSSRVSSQSRNDFSVITAIQFGNFTALLTGDTSPFSEEVMLEKGLVPKAYFLKVPHHGSKNGLTKLFLEKVQPKIATISVAKKNRYGHPSPEVLDMLSHDQVLVHRTDQEGTIAITTDGTRVWVK